MKKINALILLAAVIGMVSLTAYANTSFEPAYGFHFHHGAGFGNFGGFGNGFAVMDFGPFSRFGSFGGFGNFGGGMTPAMSFAPGMFPVGHMDAFAGFGDMDFEGGYHSPVNKIVPIPAVASAATSITFDESGEIHVRPFDDEDLFVED